MDIPRDKLPVLRVRALPTHTDIYGRVQAGWLLNELVLAGSWEAERLSKGPVATGGINAFQFAAPVLLGDMVNIYTEHLKIGKKSITLKMTIVAERIDGESVWITEVIITFDAVDKKGNPRFLVEEGKKV